MKRVEFLERLEKKLKNNYPDCEVEFFHEKEERYSAKFRLVDKTGRYVTNLVTVFNHRSTLNSNWLDFTIRKARWPDKGQPRIKGLRIET